MYFDEMYCDKCGFTKNVKNYIFTQIKPESGCYESEIKNLFCKCCNNYTNWFMGEVPQFIRNDNLSNEEIEKRNQYFKKINSVPRCLECGGVEFDENPIHECGGNLIKRLDESIRFDIEFEIREKYFYDEYGSVSKINLRYDDIINEIEHLKDGEYQTYYSDDLGRLNTIYNIKDKKLHGDFKIYSKDGTIKEHMCFIDGSKRSKSTFDNGVKVSKVNFTSNEEPICEIIYNNKGKVQVFHDFFNDTKTIFEHENNSINFKTFKKNKLHGLSLELNFEYPNYTQIHRYFNGEKLNSNISNGHDHFKNTLIDFLKFEFIFKELKYSELITMSEVDLFKLCNNLRINYKSELKIKSSRFPIDIPENLMRYLFYKRNYCLRFFLFSSDNELKDIEMYFNSNILFTLESLNHVGYEDELSIGKDYNLPSNYILEVDNKYFNEKMFLNHYLELNSKDKWNWGYDSLIYFNKYNITDHIIHGKSFEVYQIIREKIKIFNSSKNFENLIQDIDEVLKV